MECRSLLKGLVVVALSSQMAFGASYREAITEKLSEARGALATGAANCYHAAKNSAVAKSITAKTVALAHVVATKANDGLVVAKEAAGHIGDGFHKAGMTLYGGPARVWAQHRDACIVGLTLSGVVATYAIYKYRKARAYARQIEALKKQQANA